MALIRRSIHLDTHGVDDGAAVFGRLADAARAAENAGFDAISVPDHIYDPGGPASPMFEAYTVLGALAAVTSSATLLTLASPVTLRAPGLLAKAVTTLDVISGGRAVLSVGVGWDVAEHEAYGIEFPGVGERFDRLEEELGICRALLRDEQATFTGKFYAVRDAYNSPRPVRGFIPVLVAGNGEKRTLDLAARYGDACNVFGDPAEVRRKFEVLDRHCERAGRDPAEITRTVAEFDARDLGALDSSARAMAAVGADGMIVACPDDPVRIAAIGQVLGEYFPGLPWLISWAWLPAKRRRPRSRRPGVELHVQGCPLPEVPLEVLLHELIPVLRGWTITSGPACRRQCSATCVSTLQRG